MDDEPSIRDLLSASLRFAGYDVVTASDGLAGLVKATSTHPSLVLLDLMMPDLGGVRVLEEMRDDPELRDIPVIVVTGKIDAVPSMRDLLGENNVFLKPFAVGELLGRVAEVTGGPGAGG